MTRGRLLLVVLTPLAAAAGFALALMTTIEPGSAATITTYTVWNYPGPSSTGTVILNCGWHNVCTTGNDGDALNRANAAEQVVRWRSHSVNTSGHPSTGTIHRENTSSGSCFNFNARFRSILGTDLGAIRYVHTQPGSWTQFAVQSGGGFGVSMTMDIGTTKWERIFVRDQRPAPPPGLTGGFSLDQAPAPQRVPDAGDLLARWVRQLLERLGPLAALPPVRSDTIRTGGSEPAVLATAHSGFTARACAAGGRPGWRGTFRPLRRRPRRAPRTARPGQRGPSEALPLCRWARR